MTRRERLLWYYMDLPEMLKPREKELVEKYLEEISLNSPGLHELERRALMKKRLHEKGMVKPPVKAKKKYLEEEILTIEEKEEIEFYDYK